MNAHLSPRDEKTFRRLSSAFRFYKYITVILLLLFFVGGLFIFRDDITAENFRYLVKYLDLHDTELSSARSRIDFDSGESASVKAALYKNDLVVVGSDSIGIFDFFSGRIFSDTFVMTSPAVDVSDKYILVYDLGGKELRLYNSFSRQWRTAFDYPLFCADASDSGRVAVATSEKNYHSAVLVFNSAHDQIFKWLSADKYVSDVSLSDDSSDRLAVAALRASSGDFLAELLVFSTASKEPIVSGSYAGEMPLKTWVCSDRARLLTDRALRALRTDGTVQSVVFPSDKQLLMYSFFDSFSAVVLGDNTVGVHQQILVFRDSGEYSFFGFDKQIVSLCADSDRLFVLFSDSIVCLDTVSGKAEEFELNAEFSAFGVAGKDTVYLVNASGAELMPLESKPPQTSQNITGGNQ